MPGLMTQVSQLLSTLDGSNKKTTLAQLDNIRQQLMYVGGIGDGYKPYVSSANASRSLKVDDEGKLEIVGSLGSLQGTVQ